ncbi:MAG TPA: glycosyltransferase family 2 protein [Bryobacteraceae bacterium]|nr:glycosyltransferase family 2 protein [Bryobacteraceae bacterium]
MIGPPGGSRTTEAQPLVSIVTPAFQSERFIEQTIESVLEQDYPKLEYVVMDGGSTDGTLSILRRFSNRLHFISAKDRGAADAVNRGFQQCRGSIWGWINSDDVYCPGAITKAVKQFCGLPDIDIVYGAGQWIDEDGDRIGPYPTLIPFDPEALGRSCGICQPAAFFRREAFEAVGGLNPSLHVAFDYDLWIRLSRERRFQAIPELLAESRMHSGNKSLARRRQVFAENIEVLRRNFGYVPPQWVYGYMTFLRDGRDQFFEPLRHSALNYLVSLPAGLAYNRERPLRYICEWAAQLKSADLKWRQAKGSDQNRHDAERQK